MRLAILVAWLWLAAAPAVCAESLAECDRQVAEEPDRPDAWECYFEIASRQSRWKDVERHLRARLERDAADDPARWQLGIVMAFRPGDAAERILEEAVAGFGAAGRTAFEARALESLCRYRRYLGDGAGAREALRRWRDLSSRDGTGAEDLRRSLAEAELELDDHAPARARERLQAALAAGPDDPRMLSRIHALLGRVAWASGDLPSARDHFERNFRLLLDEGDAWSASEALYDVALVEGRLIASGQSTVDRVAERLDRLFELARRSGNAGAEAKGRTLLAQVPDLAVDRRIAEADRAVEALRLVGGPIDLCFALRLSAQVRQLRRGPADGPEAERRLDEAVALARRFGSLDDEARAWQMRANLASSVTDERFREAHLRAIDLVERIRDLRSDRLVRGRYLWDWEHLYQRLVGALLDDRDGGVTPEELDRAFRVMERLRSRITLDTLDAARATRNAVPGNGAAGPDHELRETLLARIAKLQRDLALPGITEDERAEALRELDRLELREASLRETIARADRRFARLHPAEIAGIEDVREGLAPDEALVLFQLSTRETDSKRKWFWNGGSWAVVVSSTDAWAVPLPDEDRIEAQLSLFLGLVRRDDPLVSEAACRLYDELVAPWLAALPADLRRLVLVPDGPLHRLPFELLREGSETPALGERFSIVRSPSATAWLGWRRHPAPPGTGMISFAGPTPMARSPRGDEPRPLGRARDEARALADLVGRARLYTGTRATETALAAALRTRSRLVHLATHAILDRDEPARSALLLSTADPAQDGLLQMREIVSLPFRHRMVVLSACSGADGELSHGEGLVGLAHGLFQAGARTVVASSWPVRDAQARDWVVALGRELSAGASVAEAMAGVRRAAIRDRRPPSEWAGWTVLGDGDFRLAPRGSARDGSTAPVRAAVVTLVASLLALALFLRRRS